jgi:hypothetical protein
MIPALKRIIFSRYFLIAAFGLEHLWLVWAGIKSFGYPMGDILFAYHPWVNDMVARHALMGITEPWVYPFPDLLFMFIPHWFSAGNYQAGWLMMEAVIDFAALVVLLTWPSGYDRARVRAGWFWILAQLLLGSVSISRLDSISVAIAIIGLVAWLRAKPEVAAVWFAIATWIKVWPVTLLAATIVEAKKWRPAAIWGAVTGGAILVLGLLLGGVSNSLSFVFKQTGRGIQIESPWATPWLWGRVKHIPGWGLYYSNSLETFQVKGPGVSVVSTILGPLMYLALAITIVLGWLIIRRLSFDQIALRNEAFAWTVLTAVLDMIVFNKVGSPQYYGWLIVPAVLGLIERVPYWRVPIYWLMGIFALTGLEYPIIYAHVLSSQPWATAILTIRNVALALLLVFSNGRLVELALEQFRKQRTN